MKTNINASSRIQTHNLSNQVAKTYAWDHEATGTGPVPTVSPTDFLIVISCVFASCTVAVIIVLAWTTPRTLNLYGCNYKSILYMGMDFLVMLHTHYILLQLYNCMCYCFNTNDYTLILMSQGKVNEKRGSLIWLSYWWWFDGNHKWKGSYPF